MPAICPRVADHPQRSRHEPLGELVRCLLIAFVGGLRIDGERQPGVAVPEPRLRRLHVNVVEHHRGGVGAPQVVKPEPGEPRRGHRRQPDAFIVRDPQGRKRILIGNLWPVESGEWYPGVALYGEHGSERVCLLLGDAGPVLSFAERGDTRLEIGIISPHS